jgi:hypothetical protein
VINNGPTQPLIIETSYEGDTDEKEYLEIAADYLVGFGNMYYTRYNMGSP